MRARLTKTRAPQGFVSTPSSKLRLTWNYFAFAFDQSRVTFSRIMEIFFSSSFISIVCVGYFFSLEQLLGEQFLEP